MRRRTLKLAIESKFSGQRPRAGDRVSAQDISRGGAVAALLAAITACTDERTVPLRHQDVTAVLPAAYLSRADEARVREGRT